MDKAKDKDNIIYTFKEYIDGVDTVMHYIIDSEMGGELDINNPWISTYNDLKELKRKMENEEEGG